VRAFSDETKIDEPTMRLVVNDPPTAIAEESDLAMAMHAAHEAVVRKPSPSIIRRPGADATHFNRYDVPCVVYGPGGGNHPEMRDKLMHAVGEHASVEKLVTAGKVYLRLALDLCERPMTVE
jgi:acetylornithine deacetylase/succinyl-diaminopimelate desuccinylase-like protein